MKMQKEKDMWTREGKMRLSLPGDIDSSFLLPKSPYHPSNLSPPTLAPFFRSLESPTVCSPLPNTAAQKGGAVPGLQARAIKSQNQRDIWRSPSCPLPTFRAAHEDRHRQGQVSEWQEGDVPIFFLQLLFLLSHFLHSLYWEVLTWV